MLSRGSINGPGGPHTRWQIPATAGGSMGSQHVLRDKLKLGIVDEKNVLQQDRDALKSSGLVVAQVTARSGAGGSEGALRGQHRPGSRSLAVLRQSRPAVRRRWLRATTPSRSSTAWAWTRSTPDHGVLLTKTKNKDRAPFAWVVDAHPEDIDLLDVPAVPTAPPRR
ncbi:Peptidase M6-like domain-containing protein OS=Streptomyces antimycoticus OX=68175 GN=SSPO_013800 PE=4 SV=1 [Streptomyces antimycoticus]